MKILYAIQGTGNGHMARATVVAPELEKHGQVDYMVSGQQVEIPFNREIKYRNKGLGFFFGKKGGVNIGKTVVKNASGRLFKDINNFPVENYDLIINDFEPITAWAAKLKRMPCVGLSHQCALLSEKSPKPARKDPMGQLIINRYAPVSKYYGFHFNSFDENIYTPIIKKEIREARPADMGHYTVYLPAYSDELLISLLNSIKEVRWEVFSKHTKSDYRRHNVFIRRINTNLFNESICNSSGVLCGAGFETPSEALFLGKKLMVVPMKNQFEQHCNAAALEAMGVPVLNKLNMDKLPELMQWVKNKSHVKVNYKDETAEVVERLIKENA